MAKKLAELSDMNRLMGLPKEGIQQAKEVPEIFEQFWTPRKRLAV